MLFEAALVGCGLFSLSRIFNENASKTEKIVAGATLASACASIGFFAAASGGGPGAGMVLMVPTFITLAMAGAGTLYGAVSIIEHHVSERRQRRLADNNTADHNNIPSPDIN